MSTNERNITEEIVQGLRRVPERRLDADWLAVDVDGHVAFLAGGDNGVVPRVADTARVLEAVEAQIGATRLQRPHLEGYRGGAAHEIEPVFDAPRGARDDALHEARFEDYPHLVVTNDAVALRVAMNDWNAREALARETFAAIFPVIGSATLDELHEKKICIGCRVLDQPNDQRLRAPELLATCGLYVYAHVDDDPEEPYRRVASPSSAADLVDLEPIVQELARLVTIPVPFEGARTVGVRSEMS